MMAQVNKKSVRSAANNSKTKTGRPYCRNLIKKPWVFIRVPLKGSMRVTMRDL